MSAPKGITILSANITGKSRRWQPTVKKKTLAFPTSELNVGEIVECDVTYTFTNSEYTQKWDWTGNIKGLKEIHYTPSNRYKTLTDRAEDPVYYLKESFFKNPRKMPLAVMLFGMEILQMLVLYLFFFIASILFLRISALKELKNRYFILTITLLSMGAMSSAEILVFAVSPQFLMHSVVYFVWIPCITLHIGFIVFCRRFLRKNTSKSPGAVRDAKY